MQGSDESCRKWSYKHIVQRASSPICFSELCGALVAPKGILPGPLFLTVAPTPVKPRNVT